LAKFCGKDAKEFSFGYQRVFHWQSVHGEDNEEKKKQHNWHQYIRGMDVIAAGHI